MTGVFQGPWSRAKYQYRRLRFPRSEFIWTIQEAATAPAPPGPASRPRYLRDHREIDRRWRESVVARRWSTASPLAPAWWGSVGASVIAIITALIGGIAPQMPFGLVIAAIVLLLLALSIFVALSMPNIWLPIATRLGYGSRYHWFAHVPFLPFIGNVEHLGFQGRLQLVAEWLSKGEDDDRARLLLLQIKVFALLEDVRAHYRRRTLSLRGYKTPTPLVVFLPAVRSDNGGVHLLRAVNDIRAQRSEFHPLLIVASADAATRDAAFGGKLGNDRTPVELYEQWLENLSAAQPPSDAVELPWWPWLLRVPVGGDAARDRRAEDVAAEPVRRRKWTWLWSWRSLIATLVACAIALGWAHYRLGSTYCSVSLPLGWNADTRLHTNGDGSRECVGVATGGVRFERGSTSIGIDGDHRRPSPSDTGSRLTLADLQQRIDTEDRAVVESGKPYVTIVYGGVFTAGPDQSELTVSSIRELAGVYLAQMRANHAAQPGEVGNSMRVRVLAVNTGQDMAFAVETADRVLHLARTDPTLVGVVGFGRNTQRSRAAIELLTRAGLPVLDTVNSSDRLPVLPHYYSLAATDHDEAVAARAAVRAELKGRPIERALVVHRSAPSKDIYSAELADDVVAALRPRATENIAYTGPDDISNKVRAACAAASYTLVYFAGRAEDMPGLVNGLPQGGCTRRHLVLLAGDDITKSRFGTAHHQVPLPANTTVYHTEFVHLPNLVAGNADQTNGFFLLARNLLGIGAPRTRPDEPLLVDGQMALAFDGAVALSQAAQNAFDAIGLNEADPRRAAGSRSITSGTVLLELRRLHVRAGATGDVDFRGDTHQRNGPGNRGLTLVKVTLGKTGEPVSTLICGRLNGGVPAPGLSPCPH